MTAHHPYRLDRDPDLFHVHDALLVALVDLNEYLHTLALRMRGAIEPGAIGC